MKRTTAFTAALLALLFAPSLQAQRWGHRDQNRYGYPDSGQGDRIAALANELEDTATYIHREFERNNRRPNRAEARVASDLHELNAQAARLRAQFGGSGYRDGYDGHGYRDGYGSRDGYGQDRRYGTDGFARLEEAFFNLSDSLRYIRPRPYVDRGMDRIYTLMNELGGYYGRSGYGRGYSGRDRYGRDRYDGRYGRDRGRDDDYDRDDDGYRPPQN